MQWDAAMPVLTEVQLVAQSHAQESGLIVRSHIIGLTYLQANCMQERHSANSMCPALLIKQEQLQSREGRK